MKSDGLARLSAVAAEVATKLDLSLLTDLIPKLSQAKDKQEAIRVVDRFLPSTAASQVRELFGSDDFYACLAALQAAVSTARTVRDDLGETNVVWSGPIVRTLPVRPTRQVVLELIGRARKSLTLITYVSGGIDDLVEELQEARLERGVGVRLIVETKEDSKDGLGPEAAVAFKNVPKAVPVYRWPKSNRGERGGSMHVKAVVQDRRAMLLSSANLTSAAFDRNMELGLLVEGGPIPERVDRHFDELIEDEQLVLL